MGRESNRKVNNKISVLDVLRDDPCNDSIVEEMTNAQAVSALLFVDWKWFPLAEQ